MDLHGGELMPLTEIELPFGDGDYLFALKLPQLEELQERRGTGIFRIYGRVLAGRAVLPTGEAIGFAEQGEAFAEDIYETIRLALIGGGRGLVDGKEVAVSPLTARKLVERYAHPAPLSEVWTIAAAILAVKIKGYDPGPKAEPAQEPAKPTGKGSAKGSTRKTRS